MKVAIAQIDTRAGDFDATVDKMVNCDAMAQACGADLLVFPAPVLMGCDPMALSECPAYVFDATSAMSDAAQRLKTPAIVPFMSGIVAEPTPDAALLCDGDATPLSMAWLVPGLAARGSGAPRNADSAPSPTSLPPVFNLGGVDVGLALTYGDLSSFVVGDVAADVICFIPFDGFSTDDEPTCMAPSVSDGCFVQDAKDANAWIVAANAVGGWEDQVFVGGSFVMAPWGELAAVAHGFTDDFLVCDIDVLSEGPLANPVAPPFYDRSRILWDAAALATRDQVSKRDLDGIVVVADGTLSSCAAVALATDAVGPMRVHALVCAQGEALADARQIVRSLRIRDVDELSWADLERAAETLGGEGSQRLAAGLVQARLGAWAQEANLLALSCVDKTALAVGASDDELAAVCQAACFAPLGDIYRSDVARIARHRNTVSPVIPTGALARYCVPSDLGLEELSTSDELRLSELDAVLLMHVERAMGLRELATTKWGKQGIERLLARIDRMAAYRKGGPLYPLLSSQGLAEAEPPLTDAWREGLHEGAMTLDDLDKLLDGYAYGADGHLGSPVGQGEEDPGSEYAKLLSEAFGASLGAGGETSGRGVLPEDFVELLSEALDVAFGASDEDDSGAGAGLRGGSVSRAAQGSAEAGAGDEDVPKADFRSQVSEVMGYLQGLSEGSRMRAARGGKGGNDDIWRGYFSDN